MAFLNKYKLCQIGVSVGITLAIAGIIYGAWKGLPTILTYVDQILLKLNLIPMDVIAVVLFVISATTMVGFFYYLYKDLIAGTDKYFGHVMFFLILEISSTTGVVITGRVVLIVALAIELVSIIVYFTPIPKKFCKARNKGGD